jgi:hypothetical protein
MRQFTMIVAVMGLFLCGWVSSGYTAEVTADMVTKEGKVTRNGKIYVKDNKCRVEKGMTPIYLIVRGDKELLWQINGAERTYVEAKLTPEMKPSIEEKFVGETGRKELGTETVNGYNTKKYEVTVKRGSKTETYHQWFTADPGFPVKLAPANGSWTVEYKNIQKAAVPDSLFELPSGLLKDNLEVPDVLH